METARGGARCRRVWAVSTVWDKKAKTTILATSCIYNPRQPQPSKGWQHRDLPFICSRASQKAAWNAEFYPACRAELQIFTNVWNYHILVGPYALLYLVLYCILFCLFFIACWWIKLVKLTHQRDVCDWFCGLVGCFSFRTNKLHLFLYVFCLFSLSYNYFYNSERHRLLFESGLFC